MFNEFKNLGFLSHTFSDQDLFPIRNEIEEIKTQLDNRKSYNENLAGNLEKEFKLEKSNTYIQELLLPFINEYDRKYDYLPRYNFISKDLGLYLQSSWVNFQKKHEFNPIHRHTGLFSFVIWLEIPYDIEDERKYSPGKDSNSCLAGCFEFSYTNMLGEITQHSIPADNTHRNMMLLFPADLNHTVYPFYTSDEYRISVSGNFKLDANV